MSAISRCCRARIVGLALGIFDVALGALRLRPFQLALRLPEALAGRLRLRLAAGIAGRRATHRVCRLTGVPRRFLQLGLRLVARQPLEATGDFFELLGERALLRRSGRAA
jgi:hypothetical protein